jgi:undecaprenyl-diphosphatase
MALSVLMDPVTAFLVGLVQGVTEWLPISSSGWTLVLAGNMDVTTSDALALAFFLHFGTLLAVLVRLRTDVRDVLVALPRWRDDALVRYLLVTTLVSLPLGLALVLTMENVFEDHDFTGATVTVLVGAMLIVTGIVLRAAKDRMGGRKVGETGFLDWAILGLAQGLAALPGISRSGMTVSALLIRKVDANESLRLSFLMSIPVTIAAVGYEVVVGDVVSLGMPVIVSGVLASFIMGYITIEGLMALSQRIRWDLFCILFGVLAVVAGIMLVLI